jgi:hypothetical protein
MLKTITRDDLGRWIRSVNPPLLLEALPERYYADKHLLGARLFSHDQVEQLAPVAAPDQKRSDRGLLRQPHMPEQPYGSASADTPRLYRRDRLRRREAGLGARWFSVRVRNSG